MKYVLQRSLEHIALVRIVATLWNQDDIRDLISKFCFPVLDKREKWQNIEDKVIEKVLLIPQPKLLKEKVSCFIKPIGLQILQWLKYHGNTYFSLDLPDEFCWTPQGTIDKRRTAEILIKNENIHVTTRYRLACIYCLENHILELWNRLPETHREYFLGEDPMKNKENLLVFFWTYDMKGEEAKLSEMMQKRLIRRCSRYQFAFVYAADNGNKEANEYFFYKLPPEEKEESLFWAIKCVKDRYYASYRKHTEFPKEYRTDVLGFLLSQMNETQQVELTKAYSYEVLKSFLDWPWQSVFTETASRLFKFLDEMDFDCLLEIITRKVVSGYKDSNYQEILGEFWNLSSNNHKKYSVRRCTSGGILIPDLFRIGDKKNIRLIFKNAAMKDKEEIIFNYNGKNICESLIYSNNLDALGFFLKECISSKEVMIDFKYEFTEHIKRRYSEEKLENEKEMWSKFFDFLEQLVP